MLAFAKRCFKEILRDPLNIAFGLGFPVVLLLLLSAIQANVPVDLFAIERLAPGVAVFGLSFLALFSSTLVAKDRESSFLQRLYATPMKPVDFILGYTLPILPLAVGQTVVCYLVAVALGLSVSVNLLLALLAILPVALFYVALGVLCGSVLNVKQVGGVCGALLTNLSAWLSGVWFDLSLVGGWFEGAAKLLPFLHAVELERNIVAGNFSAVLGNILPVAIYAVVAAIGATLLFLRQMKKN
jgi:ABC-2 type transport system permease protein